jgi:sulfur carrier protein
LNLYLIDLNRDETPDQMKLQINGEERSFDEASATFTLAALIESLGMKPDRVAVELNREIVPRDRWAAAQLKDGDRLEVVHFVGGGATPNLLSSR